MAAVAKERKTLVDKIGRKRARGLKYLLIAVPFMVYVFAFSYVPLIGWVYSVFDYKIGQRFLDFGNMVFIGLDNFKKLYQERSEKYSGHEQFGTAGNAGPCYFCNHV